MLLHQRAKSQLEYCKEMTQLFGGGKENQFLAELQQSTVYRRAEVRLLSAVA